MDLATWTTRQSARGELNQSSLCSAVQYHPHSTPSTNATVCLLVEARGQLLAFGLGVSVLVRHQEAEGVASLDRNERNLRRGHSNNVSVAARWEQRWCTVLCCTDHARRGLLNLVLLLQALQESLPESRQLVPGGNVHRTTHSHQLCKAPNNSVDNQLTRQLPCCLPAFAGPTEAPLCLAAVHTNLSPPS